MRGGATSTRSASNASSHFTTIVTDLDRGRELYEDGLDGRVLHEEASADAESVFVFVGNETVVELARPDHVGLAARRRSRARTASCRTRSRSRCATSTRPSATSRRSGVGIVDRSGDTFTLDPADCFERRLRLHRPHDSRRSARLTMTDAAGAERSDRDRHRREPRHRQGDRASRSRARERRSRSPRGPKRSGTSGCPGTVHDTVAEIEADGGRGDRDSAPTSRSPTTSSASSTVARAELGPITRAREQRGGHRARASARARAARRRRRRRRHRGPRPARHRLHAGRVRARSSTSRSRGFGCTSRSDCSRATA